jgi:NAD(P)-dependent dehydrogenase (short-subunit alcohol dehydrogenase family)
MTDIKRHLPGIFKLLRQELTQLATEPDEEFKAYLRNLLDGLLPASYGITNGQVKGAGEVFSRSMDIIIYDKTLKPPPNLSQGSLAVQQVLAVIEVAGETDFKALGETFKNIESVKTLKPSLRIEGVTNSNPARASLKPFFPLGILFASDVAFKTPLTRPAQSEDIYLALNEGLQALVSGARPDYLFILKRNLSYRNPAFEAQPSSAAFIGFSREPELVRPQICYVCKKPFQRRHFFYDQLCLSCGDFNYLKRVEMVDLSGRIALVSGGRIKIGYAVALRLLRAGARVIVSSRFPHDAARRYGEEADFEEWQDRLHIYGLDLRSLNQLEAFVTHLYQSSTGLDILVNNAAQTIRRPPAYYAHLVPFEGIARDKLTPRLRQLLGQYEKPIETLEAGKLAPGLAQSEEDIFGAANFSQMPVVVEEDAFRTPFFPEGEYDRYGQQLDLRPHNSWTERLEDVAAVDMVEAQLINAIAPALLAGRLKNLMLKASAPDRYIINVAAVEGQFQQAKRGLHPHTNMAKAALNMLTFTSASDYAMSGIFMNSVDPGWVSEQAPYTGPLSQLEKLPLDETDAAARICDPIFKGIRSGQHDFGLLLKDYEVAPW